MNLQQMIERLNVIAPRMGELAALGTNLTADQTAELDRITAEFNDVYPKAESLKAAQVASDRMKKLDPSTGTVAGSRAEGDALAGQSGQGGSERTAVDRRGPGQRFAESDEVKAYISGGMGRTSEKMSLGGMRFGRGGRLTYSKEDEAEGAVIDRYALVNVGAQPDYMVPPQVLPGIFRPQDYALAMRDVIINGRTTSDTIYFLRELAFTNNAAETAEATATSGSSGMKPESAITFEQASVPVVTIPHWVPITRQAIQDAAQLQTYVEGRLLVGLERRLNSQIVNGDGSGANMRGILNTTGIQELDADYFADDDVMNTGTANQNFERLMRAATEIELTGDAQASFIALNPRDWEKYLTSVDADRQYLAGGPFAGGLGGVRSIWGLPVARDRAIPEGTALVGDGTMAAIFDREDATIMIDTINDQFVRNMLTILAELRAALAVFRPAGFAEVTLADW